MLCGFREFYTLHSTWETDDMTMVERTTQLNAMQSMKKFFIIGVVSQQIKEVQLFIEASTSNFKGVTFISVLIKRNFTCSGSSSFGRAFGKCALS